MQVAVAEVAEYDEPRARKRGEQRSAGVVDERRDARRSAARCRA